MVSPDGEPVSLRPAIRTMIIALVDGIFTLLIILAWFEWPEYWFVWIVSLFFQIPLYLSIKYIFKAMDMGIPLKGNSE